MTMTSTTDPPLWSFKSHRFRVVLTLMFAVFMMVSNNSSLGMAITCMVNSTSSHQTKDMETTNRTVRISPGCSSPIEEKATLLEYQGTLDWEPAKQSYLFSANYYGSILTVFGSGVAADRFGPKKFLTIIFSIAAVLKFATPFLVQFEYWAYFVARFIIGMGDGFVFPCINSLGTWWFPMTEKSSMAAIYTSGIQIAAASSSLIGSRLCGLEILGGWPVIFYLYGSLGVVFVIVFCTLITDRPQDNRWVSPEELAYLERSHVVASKKKPSVPWKSIFTSPVVYSCMFCNFAFSFTTSVNLNFLPTYFKELGLPISYNGVYTTVPFLSNLFFKHIFAYAADYLKRTNRLTRTQAAKAFQALGSFGTCLAFLGLAFLPSCERTWLAVVCGFIYGLSFSSGICGFWTTQMTIAPAHAGTVTSLCMLFGQLGNAAAPNIVSLVNLMEWPYKWQIVLVFGAVVQGLSGLVFMAVGSGETAAWASNEGRKPKDTSVEMEPLTKLQ